MISFQSIPTNSSTKQTKQEERKEKSDLEPTLAKKTWTVKACAFNFQTIMYTCCRFLPPFLSIETKVIVVQTATCKEKKNKPAAANLLNL